jgi:hypothetical protein
VFNRSVRKLVAIVGVLVALGGAAVPAFARPQDNPEPPMLMDVYRDPLEITTFRPGDPIAIAYIAYDPSGISLAFFEFHGPQDSCRVLLTDPTPGDGSTGPAILSEPLADGCYGAYELYMVTVQDQGDPVYGANYFRDGRIETNAGNGSHQIDFTRADFILEAPPAPTSVERTVSLRLSGHLRVRGRIEAGDGLEVCLSDTVKIERRKLGATSWDVVGRIETSGDGEFSGRISDWNGTYRARMPNQLVETDDASWLCSPAKSSKIRHEH